MLKIRLIVWPSLSKSAVSAGHVRDLLTVAVFLIGIALPLGGYLFRAARPPANENRQLNPLPPLKLERWAVHAFPPMFEAYFNDRIGFRKELLAARRAIAFEWLGDSTSEHVWIGRDGWLFINCGGRQGGLPVFQPPADHHIDGWADTLADRHAYLAERGIAYVVLIARDKSSVYPEHLPGPHRRHPQPDPLPRLRKRLAGFGVPVVDVLPALLSAKHCSPVFFEKDSHWNDVGTFVAYQMLAAELQRHVPAYYGKTASAFRPTPCYHPGMDLAKVLGLPPHRTGENYLFFAEPDAGVIELPADDLTTLVGPSGLAHLTPTRSVCPNAVGPPALLLHDSFGISLRRFLWSDFQRFAAVGTYDLPLPVLEVEQPQVVVQLLVDRTLRHVAPMNPPSVSNYRLRSAANSSR